MTTRGARQIREWWVTTGETTPVGPVSLELLIAGVHAGKVPLDAFVWQEGTSAWARVSVLVELAVATGRYVGAASELTVSSPNPLAHWETSPESRRSNRRANPDDDDEQTLVLRRVGRVHASR